MPTGRQGGVESDLFSGTVQGMQRTIREIATTAWLRLCEVIYTNRQGEEKRWSFASRPGDGRAVAIIAETDEPAPRIVLVQEFRPAIGGQVLSFPAGLVDEGESLEVTALRELREETGWQGELLSVGPACYTSPGLTDESLHFAHVRLHTEGATAHEPEEDIEVVLWPKAELRTRLQAAHTAGIHLDLKLWAWAEGLGEKQ